MAESFCHKIKSDLLSAMLYFYHHFPVYIKIAGTFINNCTHRGEYILEKETPEFVNFYNDEFKKKYEYLNECWDKRNEREGWASACKELC